MTAYRFMLYSLHDEEDYRDENSKEYTGQKLQGFCNAVTKAL